MTALGHLAIFAALFGVAWIWVVPRREHRDRLWLAVAVAMTAVCTMIACGGAMCLSAGQN